MVTKGVTLVVPVADAEVNVPGVMEIPVAPTVLQLSVLLPPSLMLVGLASNVAIVGAAGVLAAATTRLRLLLAETDAPPEVLEAVTSTVNDAVPAVPGVPEITPLLERIKPALRDPDVIAQAYGALPPAAPSVAE